MLLVQQVLLAAGFLAASRLWVRAVRGDEEPETTIERVVQPGELSRSPMDGLTIPGTCERSRGRARGAAGGDIHSLSIGAWRIFPLAEGRLLFVTVPFGMTVLARRFDESITVERARVAQHSPRHLRPARVGLVALLSSSPGSEDGRRR